MIARRKLDIKFKKWNKRWGAPHGNKQHYSYLEGLLRPLYELINKICRMLKISEKYPDYFALQENSTTRAFEYPWVFHITKLRPGMRAIEIGGGFSGFQFILNKTGLDVFNIDPGDKDHNWEYAKDKFNILNTSYGTNVKLIHESFRNAGIEDNSIDRIFCISVLEHLSDFDRHEIAIESFRALKPGGFLIATVDLFFDIHPFTSVKKNKWGSNMNIYKFIKDSNLKLTYGDERELYGYNEFKTKNILTKSGDFLLNAFYPDVTQAFVLQKI